MVNGLNNNRIVNDAERVGSAAAFFLYPPGKYKGVLKKNAHEVDHLVGLLDGGVNLMNGFIPFNPDLMSPIGKDPGQDPFLLEIGDSLNERAALRSQVIDRRLQHTAAPGDDHGWIKVLSHVVLKIREKLCGFFRDGGMFKGPFRFGVLFQELWRRAGIALVGSRAFADLFQVGTRAGKDEKKRLGTGRTCPGAVSLHNIPLLNDAGMAAMRGLLCLLSGENAIFKNLKNRKRISASAIGTFCLEKEHQCLQEG